MSDKIGTCPKCHEDLFAGKPCCAEFNQAPAPIHSTPDPEEDDWTPTDEPRWAFPEGKKEKP